MKKLNGDRNQCQGCKEFFNSTYAFDKHRTGQFGLDRHCMTKDEMVAKEMFLGEDEFWRGSKMVIAGSLWKHRSDLNEVANTHVAT
jgi:hypothetical protein